MWGKVLAAGLLVGYAVYGVLIYQVNKEGKLVKTEFRSEEERMDYEYEFNRDNSVEFDPDF